MLQLSFAYFPIVLLIYLMTKTNAMSSDRALPICALFVYLVVIFVFNFDATLVHAKVLSGILTALTPITIITGAIFLFKCMQMSGALEIIKLWLNGISTHPIAQLMIIGWAFAFMIEGISGFGTPAAIAAPVLFSLGFPALKVAIFCLIMNTIPVTFGAVGAPMWFGMSLVDITTTEMSSIATQSAWINFLAAPVIVVLGLMLILDKRDTIFKNLIFILLSVFSCTLPYFILSHFTLEFPSVIGGLMGLLISIVLANFNIGLENEINSPESKKTDDASKRSLLKASFPIWGTILLLTLTRIEELGLKSLLQLSDPSLGVNLGFIGDASISVALVFSLENIFQTQERWQHNLLYVPSLLPFVVVGWLTLKLFKCKRLSTIVSETKESLRVPFIAIIAALIFVNLMMLGDQHAPVALIGNHLASVSAENWTFFASFMGALGSFFSGSATISNLTFAGIQATVAQDLGLKTTSILALQSVGAAMGNMVCINNIVAVSAILGLKNQDGEILKRTFLVMAVYGMMAGLIGLAISI